MKHNPCPNGIRVELVHEDTRKFERRLDGFPLSLTIWGLSFQRSRVDTGNAVAFQVRGPWYIYTLRSLPQHAAVYI